MCCVNAVLITVIGCHGSQKFDKQLATTCLLEGQRWLPKATKSLNRKYLPLRGAVAPTEWGNESKLATIIPSQLALSPKVYSVSTQPLKFIVLSQT